MKYTPKLPDSSVNVSDTNVLGQMGKYLFIVAILGALLYFMLQWALGYVVQHITPQQEQKLSAMVDFNIVHEAQKESAYLQGVTDRLSACANLPYPIQTKILQTQERNAFAVPGGKIYITEGMLKALKNENELINVIGHELGHFKHRDHLKGFGNSLILAFLSLVLHEQYGAIFEGTLKLSSAKYSQEAELEADAYGLSLMQCAYGNVASATSLFSRLNDGKKWEHFLETHPDFSARIQKMEKEIDSKGYQRVGNIKDLDAF